MIAPDYGESKPEVPLAAREMVPDLADDPLNPPLRRGKTNGVKPLPTKHYGRCRLPRDKGS